MSLGLLFGVSLIAKLGKKAYNPAQKEIANLTPSREENQFLPLEPEQFIYLLFIYLSIYLFIYLFIYSFIYLFIYLPS